MAWNARWFNGHDTTARAATVALLEDEVRIHLADDSLAQSMPLVFPLSTVLTSERFPDTSRKLQLPDGSTLAVDDDPEFGFDLALRQQGRQPGNISALTQSSKGAMACLIALIVLLVWMDRQGAGVLASLALPVVPISVDQRLGATVGEIIEKRWMAPTQIPETRMQRLSTRVKEMVDAQYPDLVWNLAFRNMRNVEDAFNAFALPGGTIVLLDGLTEVLSDNQVIAIVGHELGHVAHRHAIQRVLRQVGLLAMASVVLGDVSSLAAGVTAGYQDLHYSRDNEREADLFAIEFMRRGNVPVRHMVAAFEAIRQREASGDLPGFLSSHPPTDERMRFAQEAASP